jgi:two-component system cell cycle response regulator
MEQSESKNLNKTVTLDDESQIKSSSRHPYLVIFVGKDSGRRHKLKGSIMTIGRSPEADITIEDDRISRIHCTIEWIGDTIQIEDNGSTNGTYVESQRVSRTSLAPGIPLQLGHSVMKIEYKDEEEIRAEENLIRRASIDELTGIFNRQHFIKLASMEMSYAIRRQLPIGVIMIDIDNFKRVNDTHGHQIGDLVLARFATLVSETKRAEDLLARYGGEEFIIMPRSGINKEGLRIQCERIRKAIETFKFCLNEACIRITISIGFHLKEVKNSHFRVTLQHLISQADKALYLAKKRGKNRIETLL